MQMARPFSRHHPYSPPAPSHSLPPHWSHQVARLPPAARSYFARSGLAAHALGASFCAERLAVGADALAPESGGHPLPPGASPPARVRRADLDANGHVNNAAWLAWLMEDGPPGLACTGFDLEYRAEGREGDEVAARALTAPPAPDGSVVVTHAAVRCPDGPELLRARTFWVRPPPAGAA